MYLLASRLFLELQKAEVGQLLLEIACTDFLLDCEECIYGAMENVPFMSLSVFSIAFTNYRSSSGSTGTWFSFYKFHKEFFSLKGQDRCGFGWQPSDRTEQC